MSHAAEKAIVVLTEIAEDENIESDTRIRAACSILDLEKFQAGVCHCGPGGET